MATSTMSASFTLQRPVYRQDDIDRYAKRADVQKKSLVSYIKGVKAPSCRRVLNCLRQRFPVLDWLPKYNFKKDFISDFLAGLTIGVMMIPQSMAYGPLAGLDAAHGLYTSLFTSLFYFPFGCSYHNSYGVVAVTSMMAASIRYRIAPHDLSYYTHIATVNQTAPNATSVPHAGPDEPTPFEVMAAVTFSCGIISILLAVFRVGFLSVLISDQVSSGFTTAVAVHVLSAQIDKVLRVDVGRYSGPGKLVYVYWDLINNLTKVHVPSLVMSLISGVLLVFMKEWLSQRVMRGFLKGVPIPADMILIIIGTTVSYFMVLPDYGFKVVGHIPSGIPEPRIPKMSIVGDVFLESISVAVAIYCISISLAHIFARRFNYKVDSEQELFAVGMTHLLTSFFSCMPPCAAMARTSVLIGSGGKSQLCGLVSSVVVVLVIYFIGPLLQSLPQCVLAMIIIVALKNMFKQFSELCTLWKISKPDFMIWLGTFLASVMLDVTNGLMLGVALAFLTFGFRLIGKKLATIGVFKETELYLDKDIYPELNQFENIIAIAWKAPLFYGNANFFTDQIGALMEEKWTDGHLTPMKPTKLRPLEMEMKDERVVSLVNVPKRVLVCDFARVSLVDSPGLSAMNRVMVFAEKYQADCFVSNCMENVRTTIIAACGKYGKLKGIEFFPSTHDAVLFARLSREINKDDCYSHYALIVPLANSVKRRTGSVGVWDLLVEWHS